MHRRILPWILFALLLAACQVSKATESEIIPGITIPPGARADALYDNTQREQQSKAILTASPGGLSIGMRGTYEEMVPDSYTAYRIRPGFPFMGEYYLRSGKLEPHSYVFLCLLDYVQTPCDPDAALFQFVENIAMGDVIRIPLQLFMDREGIHDVVVLHQADPYLPGPIGYVGFEDRTLRDMDEFRANVFANDATTAPVVHYMEPTSNRPGNRSITYAFKETDPKGWQGSPDTSWPLWTEATAKAGELFNADLHFDGDRDRRYAIVAFIGFQQVPIYVQGEPHLPLFVQTQEATWQTMPIQLRAPELPGSYELRLVALGEPFTPLDALPPEKHPNSLPNPRSSTRILLRVE